MVVPGIIGVEGGLVIGVHDVEQGQESDTEPSGVAIDGGHEELGECGEGEDQPLNGSSHQRRLGLPPLLMISAEEMEIYTLTEHITHTSDQNATISET